MDIAMVHSEDILSKVGLLRRHSLNKMSRGHGHSTRCLVRRGRLRAAALSHDLTSAKGFIEVCR
jgi:hypothetical protein